MADLLTTAVSALSAFRRGLDTTSHNIANVATEGYSRQRVEYGTREAQPYGNGWLGSGVSATAINRVYDQLLAVQYRGSTASLERQQHYAAFAERVSALFSDTGAGIGASLQRFVNAVQGVAAAPASVPARQALLAESTALAGQVSDTAARLDRLAGEVNDRLAGATDEINLITRTVADLNQRIVTATARAGQPPNDLLDQRDRLIDQLSRKVAVSTVYQDDAAVNVFVGTGQPLVLGAVAGSLVTRPGALDPSALQVGIRTPSGFIDLSSSISGGELGGLIDFRREVLDPARNSIGRFAAGLAEAANFQQRAGMDLTGAAGRELFATGPATVVPAAANGGSAAVGAARTGASQLTGDDYVLEFSGSAWSMRRTATGESVALSGSGTAADPFVAEGLSLVVSGTAAAGDRFLLQPTRAAASGMTALITDPARFAAALPVTAASGAANAGSGRPVGLEVLDPDHPALRSPVTLTFTGPGEYTVDDGPPLAWVPGTPIEVNGWRLRIEGEPAAGDGFTVGANDGGVGDNRNALALLDALSRPFMSGGTASLGDLHGRIVAGTGVQTRQAQFSRDALVVVQRDAQAARESVSGVNLDEEAANLVRLQQAFQAAAQLVQASEATFQALMGALRR